MYEFIDNPHEIQAMLIAHEMFIAAIIASEANDAGARQVYAEKIVQRVQAFCASFHQGATTPQQKTQAAMTDKFAANMARRVMQISSHG